eukprot:Seg1844.2 transcript_id=Seg1844.2/GoldUCD/mRNA.D3Y31 product="hypothetical protein" protein_id=Seg1844.2/GoldUCD/D3Y31
MGNVFVLVKDFKQIWKEFTNIFSITVEMLLGITNILQDIEEIAIDLKELTDVLQIMKLISERNNDEILHQKTNMLMGDVKGRLRNVTMRNIRQRETLKSIEKIMSSLTKIVSNDVSHK